MARSPRIIAVANQKGGVGKTTTSVNLGAGLARLGKSVLVIDLDPQGNASTALGIGASDRTVTTYDFLLGDVQAERAIRQTAVSGLQIIPATTDLSSADLELSASGRRAFHLRNALRRPAVLEAGLDIVLIDCPPSLSLLTVNAMVAADSVLVPLQSEFLALEGLTQLLLTVRDIRQSANPDLRIEGVVLTMFDTRNRLSRQVEQDARETLGEMVFQTIVPRNVRLSEAPSFALPIQDYDPASKGAQAYEALARELLEKIQPKAMAHG